MREIGLNASEIEEKRKVHGLNELPETPPPTNLMLVFNQLRSPLIYILIIAGIITFILKEYPDTIVIILAVFLNTILGFIQEKKAGQALKALKQLIYPHSTVIRDGKMQTINTKFLVPGDLVVLNKGDKVPADGHIVYANRLFVSEAIITGESVPVDKTEDSVLYMGSVVTSGQAKFIVDTIGASTEMGKISTNINDMDVDETPLKKQLVKFSSQLSILVLILTIIVFIIGMIFRKPFIEIFTTSVSLAVSAIPEGLLVGLTVVLAIGMQRILKEKGLVRNLISAETLGGVSVICVDKTGTLTQGKMQVVDVHGDEEGLQLQTSIANDMDDPIVVAAYEWALGRVNINEDDYKRLDSLPFTSESKYFLSLNHFNDNENVIFINGAPELLIEKSNLDEIQKEAIYRKINIYTHEGKRILGYARKLVSKSKENLSISDAEGGFTWVGLIAFSDPVRGDVKKAFEETKKAGIKLIVITGDYANTALFILRQMGIRVNPRDVILGSDLETFSDKALQEKLFNNNDVKLFARTKPEQKMKIVHVLKSNNEIVAMMGDGVNDAPALAAADIGIVVNESSDVAKESADLILLDSSFNTIVLAIEEGRSIFDNLRKMVLYLMSDAFEGIFLITTTLILGLPLPLTAVQILWINLITDGLPNLALTVDPKSIDIMDKKPRQADELLITPWMKNLIFTISIIGGAFSFALFFLAYLKTGDVIFSRSVTFAAVGINTLIYVFSIKALKEPFWKVNIFNNKWLNIAVLGGLLLQLLPFFWAPLGNEFQLVPIGRYWFLIFAYSILMFILIEIAKKVFQEDK